jgi:hypothetical protein
VTGAKIKNKISAVIRDDSIFAGARNNRKNISCVKRQADKIITNDDKICHGECDMIPKKLNTTANPAKTNNPYITKRYMVILFKKSSIGFNIITS